MEFDWVQAVRLLHVVSGALWFGGVVFAILMIAPAVKAAGPGGRAFMAAVTKRGGFGKLFGPASGTAILTGAIIYWRLDYHKAPFDTIPSALLTIGAALAVLTMVLGMTTALPAQKRMMALSKQVGPTGPTPEQAAQLEAMGNKLMRSGITTAVLVALTFVLMAGRSVVY